MNQTETQAFKKWFGKSVVKSNGKPIVLYHGSKAVFNAIDPETFGKGNDSYGSGFYLTDDIDSAKAYGQNVIKVYARIEKPITPDMKKSLTKLQIQNLITSAPDYRESLENFGDVSYYGFLRVLREAVDTYADIPVYDSFQTIQRDFWRNDAGKFLKTMIKVTGYDGVVINLTPDKNFYVIFTPNQAKFVNNEGTWSTKDDDMRKNPKRKGNRK